jgi:hypothetical protein
MLQRLTEQYWKVMAPFHRSLSVVADAAREPLKTGFSAFKILFYVLLLAGIGVACWQYSYKPPVVAVDFVKAEAAPLIEALEKYRAERGVYPTLIREALDSKNSPKVNYIYEGVEPAPNGFRSYRLFLGGHPKAYIYESVTQAWEIRKAGNRATTQ